MPIARLLLLTMVWSGNGAANGLETRVDTLFMPWDSMTTPGCAVEAVRGDKLVLSRAYGAANLEHGVPNDPATLFEIGSVSKQFTAAAILLLARDGKLNLTDDVREYVPEMPDYGTPITIDHLLTHTSGIRDWGILDELAGWGRTTRTMTNADALRLIVRQEQLDFMPGDEYSYTNSGFVLLAIIAERISGQSLQDFSRKNLFEPLGMRSTSWRDDFRQVVPGRSVAYMNTERGYVQTMPFENVYGDAGILTSVHDLLTWNRALTEHKFGEFVTDAFQQRFVLNNGRQSNYGRGLHFGTLNGTQEISHAGGIGAYRAWLARYPEHRLSIAVACNAGDPDYTYGGDYFGRRIARMLLPGGDKPANRPFPAQASTRAGLYVSLATGMPVTLERQANTLLYGKTPLTPLSNDRMELRQGVELVFEDNQEFRIQDSNGNVDKFRKTAAWNPDETDLDDFTGRYHSKEIGTTYRIRKKDSGLVLDIENRLEIAFQLKPSYRDAFVYDIRLGEEGALVRFYRDNGGVVNQLGIGWRIGRIRDLRFALTSRQ